MKKLMIAVAVSTVSFASVAAEMKTEISGTNIRNAITNNYQFDTRDNNALVLMDGGDYHDVAIFQGLAASGLDGNRSVVDYRGSGNNNNTVIAQDRFDNDALVQATGGAAGNQVDVDQDDNNRAWVKLDRASSNDVDIDQAYNNQARVVIKGTGGYYSSGNEVDIDQTGDSNVANVHMKGNSDDNEVWIEQGGNGSRAEVELVNASDTNNANQFMPGDTGIHIVQTYNDYAGVFVTNSDHAAVYINQQ